MVEIQFEWRFVCCLLVLSYVLILPLVLLGASFFCSDSSAFCIPMLNLFKTMGGGRVHQSVHLICMESNKSKPKDRRGAVQ